MRLLYVGCHGVLEYDELRLLAPLCASIFSVGFYTDPDNPLPNLRPELPLANYNLEALEIWKEENLSSDNFIHCGRFLAQFDIMILVHSLGPLHRFEGSLPIPIVLRTIGQNDAAAEAWVSEIRRRIQSPFYIVRYSPLEESIEHFAGVDAVIRFGKFLNDFRPRGEPDGRVLTFGNSLTARAGACTYDFYVAATEPFPRALYGDHNPESAFRHPGVTPEEQLDLLSKASVYYALNTAPASYTLNFMEALAAGCPVVAVGREVIAKDPGIEERVRIPAAYEVPNLLAGAPIRLDVDDLHSAHETIGRLLNDPLLARETGQW